MDAGGLRNLHPRLSSSTPARFAAAHTNPSWPFAVRVFRRRWKPGRISKKRKKKKRDTERSPFSGLSDDLLVEIISRVPFKATRCCKCVCRRWRDVVSHPDHRKKLPRSTLAGFFYKTGNLCARAMDRHYQSLTGSWCPDIDPSFSFLPKHRLCDVDIDMLDCCNGLLLCRRQKTDYWRATDYVVCNPATEEWVAVPGTDRSREVCDARLGFDPAVSSHFHVLEFAPADDDTHVRPLGIYSSEAGVWTHRSDWECPIDINCDSELSMWALEDSSTENWTLKHNVSHLQLFGAEESSYGKDYDIIIHPEYKGAAFYR
ncbi:F-box protein At5g07610-like [Aegilops tauschii subsp. strangulata]|uniref:F-box protein At5g07610-like n=1 Tax=Aegilops tauschii subsp. strangulata TaxID=200361 RepID=UPI000989BFED